MSLIGVISSESSLNEVIATSFANAQADKWILQFPKGMDEILEFLNFDLPEIVIVNFSERGIDLATILEDVRKDTWLHNFGIIGLFNGDKDREELLLDENSLRMVWTMRRMLSAVGPNEGIELLMQRLGKTKNNAEFLVSLTKSVEASERP